MRHLLTLLLLVGQQAIAASATVRSGEHNGFTRIVVEIEANIDWTSVHESKSLEIKFSEPIDEIDVASVFRRISRQRVNDVRATRNGIRIDKSCDCAVAAFEVGENLIVIDVVSDDESYFVDETQRVELEIPISGTARTSALSLPIVFNQNRIGLSKQSAGEMQNTAGMVQDEIYVENKDVVGKAGNYEELQYKLKQQLGLAMTQGVLERKKNFVAIVPESSHSDSVEDVNEAPLVEQSIPVSPHVNYRFRNSIVSERPEDFEQQAALSVSDCMSAEYYQVQSWGGTGGYSETTADLRRQLYGEFDQLDSSIAIKLSRALVYFGFGGEALTIASLVSIDAPETNAIRQIAEILESEEVGESSNLSHYLYCQNELSLWSILSGNSLEIPSDFDSSFAIQALKKLPENLQILLAPRLSKKLRLNSQFSSSSLVMRGHELTTPIGGIGGMGGILEAAEVALRSEDVEKAHEHLEIVFSSNAKEAPQALARFIDLQAEQKKEISESATILAEGYALEYRDGNLGSKVRKAHIVSLAKSGQFNAAFELYRSSVDVIEKEDDVLDVLFRILVDNSSDVVFLKHCLSIDSDMKEGILPRTTILLAQRLSALGFHDGVLNLVGDLDVDSENDSGSILRATALNEQGKYQEAIQELSDSMEPAAIHQRAISLFGNGMYTEAALLFESIEEFGMHFESAWRIEDEDIELSKNSPSLELFRDLQDEDAQSDGFPSVEGVGNILLGSEKLSKNISDLLQAWQLSD